MTPIRTAPAALLLAAAALIAPAALADMPPPPGESERALAAIVAAAGHQCSGYVRYTDVTGAEAQPYSAKGLGAVYRVECAEGGRYLVALPHAVLRARPPRLDSNGKPIPSPPPEVTPIGR
jgi:hypothetical protein